MTGIAGDLIKRAEALSSERVNFERVWRELADVVSPGSIDTPMGGKASDLTATGAQTRVANKSRKIYESTGVWAAERLAAGMESLVTPQSEKWHGLGQDDPMAPDPTDEEGEWLDRLRDYLFAMRYDARSGFVAANQAALKSTIVFGTGLMFLDEGFAKSPVTYRAMPIAECYIATDDLNNVDTVYREFTMTARQAVQKFGDRVSPKLMQDANDENNKDRRHAFLHAVQPREERGSQTNEARNSEFVSFYIERDNKNVAGEGGFFEFPYIDYRWAPQPGQAYGEGPCMLALADIKTLNAMGKTALQAAQQSVAPPLAVADDGVMNRPNMNANAINPGAIDANGRLKIQPIVTAPRSDFAENTMTARRESVRESLYINLFQIMSQNPNMTATEALIRSNEKGQLLGPAGSRIQSGLAVMVDREIGILDRKGLFGQDTRLTPPESLLGQDIKTKFTSPLDRLRQSEELVGVQRTLEMAAQIAQFDPGVMDNIDSDEAIRLGANINGAPRSILRQTDERDEMRAQRQQQQAAAQAMQQVQEGANAVQSAGEAIPAAQELMNVAQP